MKIWILPPGEEASIWKECKDNGSIASGWNKINVFQYSKKAELKKTS